MKKIMMKCCLLFVVSSCCLTGCSTIQSSWPDKVAPTSAFNSLPRTIVIAPITLNLEGVPRDAIEYQKKLFHEAAGEEGFTKGKEILSETFQKELEPEFNILKEPPTEQKEYLLVTMEMEKFVLNLLTMVGTYGQYSEGIETQLTISKMPENEELIRYKAQTVKHFATSYPSLFYKSISDSSSKAAHLLKEKATR